MVEERLYQKAKILATSIYNRANAKLAGNGNANVLGVVQEQLHEWQQLTKDNGFSLVGIDLYLPDQLANAQRLLLKTEFAARGFQYEEQNSPIKNTYDATLGNTALDSANPGGASVTSHPELNVRGMPLQRFYIYDDELEKTANSSNDNRNDYQLSLKFSPQIDSPRLKDRAVYRPGEKPPTPMPRMDLTIRPN